MNYIILIVVLAIITYLMRTLPFHIFKNTGENRIVQRFFEYMPYAVISLLIFPDCFTATGELNSSVVGIITAIILIVMKRNTFIIISGSIASAFLSSFINLKN